MWLVIFPEGTRYDVRDSGSVKRVKSQEFARAAGLPELEHVLMPRTTGFEVCVCVRVHACICMQVPVCLCM